MITTGRVHRQVRGMFFGWWITAAGMVMQILVNGLFMQAYGAYVPLLQADFGWNKTTLSFAFALQRAENGLLAPIQGWMLDRFGSRLVMRIGIVSLGIGLMLFSRIDSLAMFYLTFLVIGIGTTMGGFMSISTTIINWFERRRATAMGLVNVGMSIGGISVPIIAWSLTTYGWRTTAFVSGILVIAIGLPCTQVMRHRPEEHGYLPDGADPALASDPSSGDTARVAPPKQVEFTVREAIRTRAFWCLSLGHSMALLVVSTVMVHLVAHLKEGLGFSVTGAAGIVSLLTAVTMGGQLVGGVMGDRFNKRIIAATCMFGHAAALLALAWASSIAMVIMFAVLQGLAHGMRGILMQPMRADYFGRQSFGKIMGFSSVIVMLGMIGGPVFAGLMADHLGDYRLGFTILAVLAGLGSVFFLLARKPTSPRRASSAA